MVPWAASNPNRHGKRGSHVRHLRSTSAQWATKQAKAAQAAGDGETAQLFLALAQGLADLAIRDVRAG